MIAKDYLLLICIVLNKGPQNTKTKTIKLFCVRHWGAGSLPLVLPGKPSDDYTQKKKKKKSDRIKHSKIQSKNYDTGKEDSFCIHKALNW